MSKLGKLTKINLISYFNFYKIKNAQNKKEKLKEAKKLFFLIILYVLIGYYLYLFAKTAMDTYMRLHIEYVLLGEFFTLSSVFTLFATIFRVDSLLFKTKDYEMLISLPIKKSTIITSKMLNLYFSNIIFTLLIMIPVLIVYITTVQVPPIFFILYIITMLIIPLIPTIVAVIIGSFISALASRFKIKKVIQMLSMLFIVGVSFYFSYSTMGTEEIQIANIGESMVNLFNYIYPLTNTYIKVLIEYDYYSLLLYIAIPIIMYLITTIIISFSYINIVTKLNSFENKRKYKLKKIKINSPTKAILKKEFKRYITSPNYIMNSTMGVIMLIIASGVLLFISPEKIEIVLGFESLRYMIMSKGPLLFGALLMLSCTSCSSISLEGKNLWIMKSLPVKTIQIFIGKIALNFLLLVIPGIVCAILITYTLHLGINTLGLFILTILTYALFISSLGLIINLHFPLLKWENEIKVIKQSVASFITIFGGLILGMIPLFIKTTLNATTYVLLINGIIFLITGFLWIYLNKIGTKKFLSLYE